MIIYIVNSKYYYADLDTAIEKAKEILRKRGGTSEKFCVTEGKNHGYCVHLDDSWQKVGNSRLLNVIIRTVKSS